MDDKSSNPTVILISEFCELSTAILKGFAKREMPSFVVARNIQKWKSHSPGIKVFPYSESPPTGEYAIYIDDYFGETGKKEESLKYFKRGVERAINIATNFSCKLLFVSPLVQNKDLYEKRDTVYKKLLKQSHTAGVLFLGELLSDKIFSAEKEGLLKIVSRSSGGGEDGLGGVFYPLLLEDAAEEIVRAAFSLGAFGKRTAVYASPIRAKEVKEIFGKLREGEVTFGSKDTILAEVDESIVRRVDTKKRLSKMFKEKARTKTPDNTPHLSRKKEKEEAILPKITPSFPVEDSPLTNRDESLVGRIAGYFNKIKRDLIGDKEKRVDWWSGVFRNLPRLKKVPFSVNARLGLVLTGALVFLTPLFFLLVSFFSITVAKHSFQKGNVLVASKGFEVASTLANYSKIQSGQFSRLPAIGSFYEGTFDSSRLTVRVAETGIIATSILEDLTSLYQNIFQEAPYDIEAQESRIVFGMDELYKSLGFLEGLVKNSDGLTKKTSDLLVNESSVPTPRKKVWFSKSFLKELSEILGQNETKTYLVLFQENKTPRPTGGVITAYALVEISGGRLGEVSVFKSSPSGTNLGGRVDAPAPLSEYFGLDSWGLRDSNWSPDFPTSAQRAEWFIEKKLGESVDGVVGVDERFVKTFLPKAKEEDPDQLLESFINTLSSLDKREVQRSLFLIVDALNERSLQVFIHHRPAQRAVGELAWDGSLQRGVACSGNCEDDFVGVIEAHTSRSVFDEIEKEALLEVSVEEGVVKESLTLFIENTGKNGSYEGYVRVFVPAEAGFGFVREVETKKETRYQPQIYGSGGFKEAGVFVKVPPGSAKALVFSWERGTNINLSKSGSYHVFWRKQAGINPYPIEIKIGFPETLSILTDNHLALTKDSELLYNTELTRDTSIRVFW